MFDKGIPMYYNQICAVCWQILLNAVHNLAGWGEENLTTHKKKEGEINLKYFFLDWPSSDPVHNIDVVSNRFLSFTRYKLGFYFCKLLLDVLQVTTFVRIKKY